MRWPYFNSCHGLASVYPAYLYLKMMTCSHRNISLQENDRDVCGQCFYFKIPPNKGQEKVCWEIVSDCNIAAFQVLA